MLRGLSRHGERQYAIFVCVFGECGLGEYFLENERGLTLKAERLLGAKLLAK